MYEIEKLRIEAPDLPLQYLKETFPELKVAFFRKALDGMVRDYVIRSLYGIHGKKKPKKAKDRKPEQRRKLEYERLAPTLKKIKTQVDQLRGLSLPPTEFVAQFKELALQLTREFFDCCVQPNLEAKLKDLRATVAKPLRLENHAPLTNTILGQYFGTYGRDVPLRWMLEDYSLVQIDDYLSYHNRDVHLEQALVNFISTFGDAIDEDSPTDFVAFRLTQLLSQRGINRADAQALMERCLLPKASEPIAQKLRAAQALAFQDEDYRSALEAMLQQGVPQDNIYDLQSDRKEEGQLFWSDRVIPMINLIMHPFVQYDLQGQLHAGFAYIVVGLDYFHERCYPILTLVKLLGQESGGSPIMIPGGVSSAVNSLEDVISQVVAHLGPVLTDAKERARAGQNALELPQSQIKANDFARALTQGAEVVKDIYYRRQRFAVKGVTYSSFSELEILSSCFGLNFEHLISPELLAEARANAGDVCFEPDLTTEEGRNLAPGAIYFHPYYKLLFEQMTEQAFKLLPQYLELNELSYISVHSLTAEIRPLCAKYLPFTVIVPQCLSELFMLMHFYPETIFRSENDMVQNSSYTVKIYEHWLEDDDTYTNHGLNSHLEQLLDNQVVPSLAQYLKRRIKERFDPLALAADCSIYTLSCPFEMLADSKNWLDSMLRPELADPQQAANALTYLGNLMSDSMCFYALHKFIPSLDNTLEAVDHFGDKIKLMRVRLGQTQYKVEELRQEIEPDQINYVPAQLGQFDESYGGYEDLQQLSAQFQDWQDSFQLTFYDVEFQPTVDVWDDAAFIAKVEEFKAALDAGTLKRELPDFNVKERLAEDRGELDDDFSDELNFTDDASDFSFEDDDDDVSDFSFDDDDEEVTKAQPDLEQKAEDDDDVSDFSFDDDDEETAQPESEQKAEDDDDVSDFSFDDDDEETSEEQTDSEQKDDDDGADLSFDDEEVTEAQADSEQKVEDDDASDFSDDDDADDLAKFIFADDEADVKATQIEAESEPAEQDAPAEQSTPVEQAAVAELSPAEQSEEAAQPSEPLVAAHEPNTEQASVEQSSQLEGAEPKTEHQAHAEEVLGQLTAHMGDAKVLKADDIKFLVKDCAPGSALDKAKLCDEVDYLSSPYQTDFQDCFTATVVLFSLLMVKDFTLEDCCEALLRKELFFSAQTQDPEAIESFGFAGNEPRLKVLVAAALLAKCQTPADVRMIWTCLAHKGLVAFDGDNNTIEEHSVRDVQQVVQEIFELSAEDLDDAIDISESLSEDVTTYQSAIATVKANQESRLEKRLHQIIAHTMGQEA